MLIDSGGILCALTPTSAHIDERVSLYDIIESIQGVLIADKKLIDTELKEALAKKNIDLQTPLCTHMEDHHSQAYRK